MRTLRGHLDAQRMTPRAPRRCRSRWAHPRHRQGGRARPAEVLRLLFLQTHTARRSTSPRPGSRRRPGARRLYRRSRARRGRRGPPVPGARRRAGASGIGVRARVRRAMERDLNAAGPSAWSSPRPRSEPDARRRDGATRPQSVPRSAASALRSACGVRSRPRCSPTSRARRARSGLSEAEIEAAIAARNDARRRRRLREADAGGAPAPRPGHRARGRRRHHPAEGAAERPAAARRQGRAPRRRSGRTKHADVVMTGGACGGRVSSGVARRTRSTARRARTARPRTATCRCRDPCRPASGHPTGKPGDAAAPPTDADAGGGASRRDGPDRARPAPARPGRRR